MERKQYLGCPLGGGCFCRRAALIGGRFGFVADLREPVTLKTDWRDGLMRTCPDNSHSVFRQRETLWLPTECAQKTLSPHSSFTDSYQMLFVTML